MLDKDEIAKIKKLISTSEHDTQITDIFKLLGDKNRYLIIKLLFEQEELCVSDLSAILDSSMSSVSQHLRVLEISGLIKGERMGQMICYKLLTNNPKVRTIFKLIK